MSLREQWNHFIAIRSGRRFITRYRERQGRQGGLVRKGLIIGVGVLLMLAGMVMLVLPGPGLVAMIIGAAFIAEESRLAAHVLDRIDVWGSQRLKRWRAWRRRDPADGRS